MKKLFKVQVSSTGIFLANDSEDAKKEAAEYIEKYTTEFPISSVEKVVEVNYLSDIPEVCLYHSPINGCNNLASKDIFEYQNKKPEPFNYRGLEFCAVDKFTWECKYKGLALTLQNSPYMNDINLLVVDQDNPNQYSSDLSLYHQKSFEDAVDNLFIKLTDRISLYKNFIGWGK